MASSQNPELCLEELEESRRKVQESREMWHRQVASLAMGQYSWWILEHGRKSDSMPSHE